MRKLTSKSFVCVIFILIIVAHLEVMGQNSQENEFVKMPKDEKFEPADGLIETTSPIQQQIVRLYNSDGSVWYEFNLDEESPFYFKKNPKTEYKPFAPMEKLELVFIRIKECSKSWCGVVVNESTQEIKYVSRYDKSLGWETLEETILHQCKIRFDLETNYIFESPDSKSRKLNDITSEYTFCAEEFDGEWLKILILNPKMDEPRQRGWIKWKNGRTILIKYIYNSPELFL